MSVTLAIRSLLPPGDDAPEKKEFLPPYLSVQTPKDESVLNPTSQPSPLPLISMTYDAGIVPHWEYVAGEHTASCHRRGPSSPWFSGTYWSMGIVTVGRAGH